MLHYLVIEHATLHCKPLLFWFPCKRWYINVWTFNLHLIFNIVPLSKVLLLTTAMYLAPSYIITSFRVLASSHKFTPGDQRWQKTSYCSVEDWQKVLATSGDIDRQLSTQ